MQLTDINLEAFGVLAGCRLEDLEPGLNVIYGSNGAGKTTLARFLRGVWAGFDEARNLRLLPPLVAGQPGGSVGFSDDGRLFRVTRHALANQSDRLAIAVRRGTADEGAQWRARIERIPRELLQVLFTVTAGENHACDRLLKRAADDGIPLTAQRRPSRRFDARLLEVQNRRHALLGGEGTAGQTESLRLECRQARLQLDQLQAEASRLHAQLDERFSGLLDELEQLTRRMEWLDLERQAVESDLIEAETRAASISPSAERRVVYVECDTRNELGQRIAQIDARIAHTRQVLEDLAHNRTQVSLQGAQLAGVDERDAAAILDGQRQALDTLERETLALRNTIDSLARAAAGACQCREFESQVRRSLTLLQQHLYTLCGFLGRQQQRQQHVATGIERSRLDQCERELLEHVARLLRERDDVLREQNGSARAALRYPTDHQAGHCQCLEHQAFADSAGPRVRVTVKSHTEQPVATADDRIPDWRRRRAELHAEWQSTAAAWRAALTLQADWEIECARLALLERHIAAEAVAVDARERRLAECVEEGQSLVLLEACLRKMQAAAFDDEASPVIARAAEFLRRLTGGRYLSLDLTAARGPLAVVNDSGIVIPVGSLSRGAHDQVSLALRLALAEEYARRGWKLPLVFDDVLADTDQDRLVAAIQLLREVGLSQQILYLTCQESVAAAAEQQGLLVRDFPGSRRARPGIPAPHTRPAAAPLPTPVPEATTTHAQPFDLDALNAQIDPPPAPIHPGEPFWLRADSSVTNVPSLGEQMARRLATAGIAEIGDLVFVEADDPAIPWHTLQVSAAQLRIWQAEARLLCCVPRLTGRDAQVLVAVGIFSPAELAEADTDALVRKIDRLRGDGRSGWVSNGFVWPDRRSVGHWIQQGRAARSFRQACDAIGWTSRRADNTKTPQPAQASQLEDDGPAANRQSRRLRDGRRVRFDQPSAHRRARRTRAFRSRLRTGFARDRFETAAAPVTPPRDVPDADPAPPLGEPQSRWLEPTPARLRFYLEPSSPIIEAPSIGPTTARRLEQVGVLTVNDLLSRDPQQLVDRLQHSRINADMVASWQQQARLMCRVPELRGHDAQVLAACGLVDPERVARMSPQELFSIVGPFVATREGQRLLRSSKTPDLAEVTDWITWSQQARAIKAA